MMHVLTMAMYFCVEFSELSGYFLSLLTSQAVVKQSSNATLLTEQQHKPLMDDEQCSLHYLIRMKQIARKRTKTSMSC